VNVLGINSAFHESAAAVVVDGTLLAAAEEERFSRVKHGTQRLDKPHVLPEQAIRFCLDYARLRASEIDCVAYSFDPKMRRAQFRTTSRGAEAERLFLRRLDQVPHMIDDLFGRSDQRLFVFLPHHLSHAACAYYLSGFNRAAILVVDGIGENACSSLAYGEAASIQMIESFDYPNSLGFIWEIISLYLGFSEYDASKTMGLAAYGDPSVFSREFASLVEIAEESYAIDPDVMGERNVDYLERRFGCARKPGAPILDHHRHVAAALQERTNAAVLALVRRLKRAVNADQLCLAGGVALNCVTNNLIKQAGMFSEIFVPSAPHDAGTAVGAALLTHHANSAKERRSGVVSPYLGPEFSDEQILAAISAAGLKPQKSREAARDAAEMVAAGKIVAWFQGRMEFGPRALGNRSLIADPRRHGIRDVLNFKIKNRESFRPFAPSILAEHADQWFELGRPSRSHEYMLFACPAKPEYRASIPAVLHQDGTARLQLVHRESNAQFYNLISHVLALTGVPLVLNTSFNDSEPIICTPDDAIATFRTTGIDALFMGKSYLIREGL
jgi:carbamoyltransferase